MLSETLLVTFGTSSTRLAPILRSWTARPWRSPLAAAAPSFHLRAPGRTAGDAAERQYRPPPQAQPPTPGSQESHTVETVPSASAPTAGQIQKQYELAAHPAVKIYVRHEGWYRVTQPDLVKAGLDPNVDPSLLHLYAEATELPLQITGATAGPGGFGPQAAINFYGTGINTAFSGTRVYWLVAGDGGVFAFGAAPYEGSLPGVGLHAQAVSVLPTHTGLGYLIVTADGQVVDFGDAPQFGDVADSVAGWQGRLVGGATSPG